MLESGGVGLFGQAEALAHRGQGDPVDVIDGTGQGEGIEGLAPQVGPSGQTCRREVVEVLVMAGDSQVRRRDGA